MIWVRRGVATMTTTHFIRFVMRNGKSEWQTYWRADDEPKAHGYYNPMWSKCCQHVGCTMRINLSSREEEGTLQWKFLPTMRISIGNQMEFVSKEVNSEMAACRRHYKIGWHDVVKSSHLGILIHQRSEPSLSSHFLVYREGKFYSRNQDPKY